MRRIEVHGHRGARALFPENTLPGFQYAIAAGADYLELDLAATRDDAVVVCHDAVLRRRIFRSPGGSRAIRRMTLAELSRWECGAVADRRFPRQRAFRGLHIPTLEEVLELGRGSSVRFNLEVKSSPLRPLLAPPPGQFAALVLKAVRRLGMEQRVLIQSFDFRVLEAVHALAPRIPLSALFQLRWKSFRAVARRAGTGLVSPHHRLVSARRVAAAHAAGIQVLAWTANNPHSWARLVRAGVDGIITDDPAGLIEFLGK